ncbi:MAG TPA: AraC family transcriptional regulator [Pedobacter sp.]|jgi:AraC-like DNA-binding protein
MQPVLIKVNVPQKASFSINRYKYDDKFPGIWHFHDEFELTLITKSNGSRLVGDNIDNFKEGDLVLLGKNLPHTWRNESSHGSEALVIHFFDNFLGDEFFEAPEMYKVKRLLSHSRHGLNILGSTNKRVVELMNNIERCAGSQTIISLLTILQEIAESEEFEGISSEGFANSMNLKDSDRLKRVYEYIMNHFDEDLNLNKAAAVANMSPSAFSRYFKSRTRKSFTQFVIEMKIGYCCKLLINEKLSIADVCYKSGFQNLSNFNQHFKDITGLTPKRYQSLHSSR